MSVAAFLNRSYVPLLLAVVVTSGVTLIAWPLVAPSDSAPSPLLGAVPVIAVSLAFVLLLNEVVANHLTIKALAISGIVVALAAALRPLGAGVAGIEPMWVILILAARAFGSTIGFVIAVSAMTVSALVTGGVGPWLPYQIVGAGLMAFIAGALPQWRNRAEIAMLMIYSAIATFFFGWIMNLWFWQSLTGLQNAIAYDATASSAERIHSWITYNLTTSLGFDLPRALFTSILVALTAKPLLATLRRANRKFSHTATALFSADSP